MRNLQVKPRSIPWSRPKRLPERKPHMTFILGLNCLDGIVLSADSREEDGTNKKNVDKLLCFQNEGNWGMALGCSGYGPGISVFEENISELFQGTTILRESYNRENIQVQLESAILAVYKKYPDQILDVIYGIWGKRPLEKIILHALHGVDCPEIVRYFGIAGADASLANTLLSSMYLPSMEVAEVIRLAVFVTSVMKEKSVGVGGPTKVMSYKFGDDLWRECDPHEITALETKYPVQDFYDYLLQYWAKQNPDFKFPLDRFP
jgi:20S proteasome alpha/beta subunit